MIGKFYNFIKTSFLEETSRWPLWLPIFFCIGIMAYFTLPSEPPLSSAAGLVAGFAVLLFFAKRNKAILYSILCLVIVALGFSAVKIRVDYLNAPMLEKEIGPITISGNIEEVSYSRNFPRLVLSNLRIDDLPKEQIPARIRLNVRTEIRGDIEPGSRVITDATLLPPPRPVIPGGYDFARWAYFNQIGANGYAIKPVIKLKWGHEEQPLNSLRYDIGRSIDEVLDGQVSATAIALVTGDRAKLDKLTKEHMRASGLAHLLAISGLHVSMVAGFLFFAARGILAISYRASENWPIKKIAALASLLGSFAYLLISGTPVSAERAFLMISLILLAVLLDRSPTPMRSMAFAALAILVVTPEQLLFPGFQMSFIAVICLIGAYEFLSSNYPRFFAIDTQNSRIKFFSKFWLYPIGVMTTTLIAGFATAPVAAFHFNRFAVYGALANLFAVPVMTFVVMPAGVISGLLMPFGLEFLSLPIMGAGIDWILTVAEKVANFEGSTTNIASFSVTSLVLIIFGILWLCFWQTKWRALGFLPLLLAFVFIKAQSKPDIIVDEKARLFGLNIDGELQVSNRRRGFKLDEWLGHFGQNEIIKLSKQDIYEVKGKTFSLKCVEADIIISDECEGRLLTITKEQLAENGTHMIFIKEDGDILLENVAEYRGDRIWTK